jgi:cyclic beta-1,2-glucan synthetase
MPDVAQWFRRVRGPSPWDGVEVLREELFSIERLEEHAASLAVAQESGPDTGRRLPLGARLDDNEAVLLGAYRTIAQAVSEGRGVSPAAEWLLDNYHLVEAQIVEIRDDLPPGFYRQLPKLSAGHLKGYPRVLGIAWAFIAHTDSHFDPDALQRFIRAYQRVQPLTIGELWAIAITLRIVLVENLRRAALRIVGSRAARQEADAIADRLLGVNGQTAEPGAHLSVAGPGDERASAFIVQLLHRLRDQDPDVTPALLWLEAVIADQGTTAEAVIHDAHQRQGASNVTVRNIITSMRLISELKWSDLVENVSLVDAELRAGSGFSTMDFATRNLYRSAIEALARGSGHTEIEVARAAVAALAVTADAGDDERDPGYHLVGPGRQRFEHTLGYRVPAWERPGRLLVRHGAGAYIAAILVTAAIIVALPLLVLSRQAPWFWTPLLLGVFAAVGFLPALDAAVALVNRAVTRGCAASLLPALALRDGVPPELRTLVAIPVLLTSAEAIEEQVERLEVHHLASPDGDLHFALLSDWVDSDTEELDTDRILLEAAARGIERLNLRYPPSSGGQRFLILHRRRLWSGTQQKWMGWERKRGKLHELNRLLRGQPDTSFLHVQGVPPAVPPDVRFVITLDADTRLPRDTVRRLVGKLAHPLNRPRFDSVTGRVVEGYGVLQPRVTPALPMGREGSLFQRIMSGAPGLDPYAAVVSDVYQDLFGEGSYAGKGIYDIDAFEAALADRVPDGTLLSHDLFEGIHARAGLVSDIEVVEEFPARYDVAAARQHRWARGDWQLLPWLLGRRDARGGQRRDSALPLIGAWKILDNLRRTLSAPAALLAFAAGWTLALDGALAWTVFMLLAIALPALLPAVAAVLPGRAHITPASHIRALGRDLSLAGSQIMLQLALLPHQAWLMADAISRTLFRLTVSHRNLLQWVTADQASHRVRLDTAGFYRRMAGGLGLTGLVALAVWLAGAAAAWVAAPFLALWLASPALALWISRPPRAAGELPVSPADEVALRLVARRTWRYFETFVTPEDHMLPPDNFQEDPRPVVAHRTSPTNLGLYLLATVSARDFGWAGTLDTADRLAATLATMSRLQLCRGHFYNWYDTRDLRPLEPHYVSSVDSGNLAAHLITLANAAREWRDSPGVPGDFAGGARDALALARQAMDAVDPGLRGSPAQCRAFDGRHAALASELSGAAGARYGAGTTLHNLTPHAAALIDAARALAGPGEGGRYGEVLFWAEAAQASLASWQRDITLTPAARRDLMERLATIELTARAMADAMDFEFLLDPQRRLLSIGYRPADSTLDESAYDLLASEARLASFVAIAKGDVPSRHWYRLGRQVTAIGTGAALISWSGSMFEYLMPSLVMRAPAGSLLERTSRLVVQRQISYGRALGVPWGISESAYNGRDLELTYQYSSFGIPGLGLKRGLSADAVIAPYATALAAMVDPGGATRNLARLATLGALGRHGFYEALDYTRSRLPDDATLVIVRAFMAHHQGMTIVAIANVLLHGIMRRRFHAEPRVQATELLLQERPPRDLSTVHPRAEEVRTAPPGLAGWPAPAIRRLGRLDDLTPQVQLLSNGSYGVMLTAAGSGYSRWKGLAVTRWREDVTQDDTGSYIFLRDATTGLVWSASHQPCGASPENYSVVFAEDRAEFVRTDALITTTLTVLVSPEDDAEVRHLAIANAAAHAREIDVTSYAELVLAPRAADLAHPAFSKLFVETEYVPGHGAILATRRKRSPDEPDVWVAHQAVVEGGVLGEPCFETDRARFLGRCSGVVKPCAVMDGRRLANTAGAVLDPVFALRHRLRVPPGGSVRIAFWTVAAGTRQSVLDLLDKHLDPNAFVRAGTLAWTQAQVQLRHLGITAAEAGLFQQLAGHVLFADAALRPTGTVISQGGGGPAGLWSQGISGDLPIVLLRISDVEDLAIAQQLLRAQEYWRMKQLAVDLVILNERAPSYVQDLQTSLETQLRTSQSGFRPVEDGARGSVYILRKDLIPDETCALLSSVARVVLVARRGSLADQLELAIARRAPVGLKVPAQRTLPPAATVVTGPAPGDLEFFNGLGGFAADGREYVTLLAPGERTPAPWINVLANPGFGCQVAAEGSGYSWAANSRENQLTPWSNDPVSDRPGEAMYIQDEATGDLWGPTASPVHDPLAFHTARHGQGYSRFEHESRGVYSDLLVFVPVDDPVRIARLRLRNTSGKVRRLCITVYVEWVLGPDRSAGAPHITTEHDAATGAIFARNPWNAPFASRVAFADLGGRHTAWTADRREFIGRHGTLAAPAALIGRRPLSRRVGAGLDPCAALQVSVSIAPGETAEVDFFLGQAADSGLARELVQQYRVADLDAVFRRVLDHWDSVLDAVQVKTPERSFDILLNRWLLYQSLVCRVWARAAFYQASGAYGFRDQLQDGMALAVSRPDLTREHLLRAAARQFPAGDVQHWWLPHNGQGVRTRISDDMVWLAFASVHYVRTTGDVAVLDETVPFIEGQTLKPGEHDAYFLPTLSEEAASLYEHCAMALDRSCVAGRHGLPLMGTGDWNDGMNRVGVLGSGESVWLGWFLYATLQAFRPLAEARGDTARSTGWQAHATALQGALEREAWDGNWYLRGYFDDGTPLGSATSEECQIDSIAQSWSVLSGAGDIARSTRAMAAVGKRLIQRDDALALLFTPPFDLSAVDPGYIKGYPPGIRENGGQYTHAATWSVLALAALGHADEAASLFSLLNPINRTTTREDVERYRVEPYVVAADIYSVAPHVGRGGWTWYTGSAGWLYRAGLEGLLGFHLEGAQLRLAPGIPGHWRQVEIAFRHHSARYEIRVENPTGTGRGVASVHLDGQPLPNGVARVPLVDDGATHTVRVVLGRGA